MTTASLEAEILRLVEEYARQRHAPMPFVPGETPVPVSGKVFGAPELRSLTEAALEFWLTSGRFDKAFVQRLSGTLGVSHVQTVNSGSSALLLAVSALTSPLLGDRALKPGDEVITVAAGFPTTVNPLLLYDLVPVFVDIELGTYDADAAQLEAAIGPRTRAIVMAHTLGNPFNLDAALRLAKKRGLWVIEDCCDALGSQYTLSDPSADLWPSQPATRSVGSFGHIGTLSFYPAHHITTGEGGATFTRMGTLKRALESIRDWGRDCYCDTGKDDTCGKRFGWQLGGLPFGYDHKYTYSHLGFNLKMTDLQAAVGLAQLDRLPDFVEARRRNFARLREALKPLQDRLILPEATPGSQPSWFGFPITVREGVKRLDLIRHLEGRKVATRLLFGGNLTRQPYFEGRAFRTAGPLTNTDVAMERSFWLGVFPGLTDEMIDYVAKTVAEFFCKP